jgi:hypothetical protein
VPVVRRDSALNLPAFLAEHGRWRYAAGLAAAVLIAVGWLSLREKPRSDRDDPPTVAGHELLRKTIGRVVTDTEALAKVDKSEQRMRAWADMTRDLRDEVQKVHLHAPKDDLRALAGLFEKAALKGLLEEARKVADDQTPADRRRAAFRDAKDLMTRIGADAAAFALTAPPDKKQPLQQIRDTAGAVLKELSKLEARHAGTGPAKGA